jgi:predicted nucleic acid-binding protein
MSELIYIDTNVWVSLFKNEEDYLRPISEFSFMLFKKVFSCKYDILISEILLQELKRKCDNKELKHYLQELKRLDKIKLIKTSHIEREIAKKSRHYYDRLHEILAHKGKAKYLVTRNIKDFEGDLLEIKLPENL